MFIDLLWIGIPTDLQQMHACPSQFKGHVVMCHGSASSHQCAAAHTCHGGGYAGGVGTKRFDGSTMLGCSMLVTVFLMRAFVACVFFFAWTSTIIYQKLIACLGAAPFRHVTVSKGNNDHQPTMKQHLSQNLETS